MSGTSKAKNAERYERSARKQREWFRNMSDEERAEWDRKRRAGMKRCADGARSLQKAAAEDASE